VNIAERAMDLNQAPPLAAYVDMPRLAELAQEQVKKALDSFVRADPTRPRRCSPGTTTSTTSS
jgi:phosphate transport system protein